MTSSWIRTLGESIGVAAVVASLIFVGLEIRQNAEATRAATVEEVTSGWRDYAMNVRTDPEVWDAVERVLAQDDFAASSSTDLNLAAGVVSAQLTILANAYYHFEEGLLPDEFWDANHRILDSLFIRQNRLGDLTRWEWQVMGYAFPTSFRALVDSIIAAEVQQPQ